MAELTDFDKYCIIVLGRNEDNLTVVFFFCLRLSHSTAAHEALRPAPPLVLRPLHFLMTACFTRRF